MEYLDVSHPEWDSMWQQLADYPINKSDPLCVNQGLCWEYMGSTADHHNFRHSKHPVSGRIEHAYIERIRTATMNCA